MLVQIRRRYKKFSVPLEILDPLVFRNEFLCDLDLEQGVSESAFVFIQGYVGHLQHVAGLASFRRRYTGRLLVEVMLLRHLNDSEEALTDIARHLASISPDEVHISLPERPPAEEWVRPADAEGVMRASAIFGEVAKVLSPGGAVLSLSDDEATLEALLGVIGRHPLSQAQLMHALTGLSEKERGGILTALEESGRAKPVRRHGHVFWVSSSARFPDEERGKSN